MAQIQNVDYEALPKTASAIRGKGEKITKKLEEIYKKVEDMHKDWYGDRYNDLAKAFNKMKPTLAKMQVLIQTEIPAAIEKAANNYAIADRGKKVCSVNEAKPKSIGDIPVKKDVGMKFLDTNVDNTKNVIKTQFDEINNLLNEAENEFSKVPWQSADAKKAFQTKIAKVRAELAKEFTEVKKQFNTSVTNTVADIRKTEKTNTVS